MHYLDHMERESDLYWAERDSIDLSDDECLDRLIECDDFRAKLAEFASDLMNARSDSRKNIAIELGEWLASQRSEVAEKLLDEEMESRAQAAREDYDEPSHDMTPEWHH